MKRVIVVMFVCAVMMAWGCASSKNKENPVTTNAPSQETFKGFVITTKEEGYDISSSQTPGMLFTVGLQEDDTIASKVDQIKMEGTSGELLCWDSETGIVTSKGIATTLNSGDSIYWSPLAADKSVAETAELTIIAEQDGKVVGKQKIHIEKKENLYYATVGEVEH